MHCAACKLLQQLAAMSSGKKSALTAALSGVPTSSAPSVPSTALLGLGSLDAFPCLAHAPDDGSSVDGLAEGVEALDLSKVQLVGSVPTNTTAPNGRQLVSRARHAGRAAAGGSLLVTLPRSMHVFVPMHRRRIILWIRIADVVAKRRSRRRCRSAERQR